MRAAPKTTITYSMSSLLIGCAPPIPSLAPTSVTHVEKYAPATLSAIEVPTPAPDRSEHTITLDGLLAHADANAPSILTAKARVGLATADLVDARITAPSNPQLSLNAGPRTSRAGAGLGLEVGLQQELPNMRARDRALTAASSRELHAEALVNETRWAVHVDTHRLFVTLLLLDARRTQAERFVALSESTRDVAHKQVEAGESSPLVLLVADADLAQTRADLIVASSARLEASQQLAALTGWPDDTLPELSGELPDARPAPKLEALLATMTRHHPSLRAREIAVLAARDKLEFEQSNTTPRPTLGVSYGREGATTEDEPSANLWMFGVTLPLPIWRTNQRGRALAAAELDVAARERDAGARALRAEVQRARVALNAALARVQLYESSVMPQLEENLELLSRAYALGEVDIHQVSQTRARLLEATSAHLDARITYYTAAATLEGLIGAEIWPTETPRGDR